MQSAAFAAEKKGAWLSPVPFVNVHFGIHACADNPNISCFEIVDEAIEIRGLGDLGGVVEA